MLLFYYLHYYSTGPKMLKLSLTSSPPVPSMPSSSHILSIFPTKMYFNDKNKVKVEISLAKGKHTYDKKKDLMKSDLKRYAERQIKIG